MIYVTTSRPSRARGLKRVELRILQVPRRVAPLAGAWIETLLFDCKLPCFRGRAPRGRVD